MDPNQTEAAELESGYSDDKPAATPTVVKEPEKKDAPVEPVVKDEAPDPLKEIATRLDKFEETTRKLAGHIGGLTSTQKEIQQTLAASKAAAKNADEAPTQAQVTSAMEDPDEWKALKTDFPEWAAGMEKFLDHRLAAQKAPASDDIEKAFDKRMQDREAAQTKERADEISEMHPGWQGDLYGKDAEGKSVRTADYEAWTKTMTPEQVQKFENSNSVLYVDRKLTEFYAWKKAQAEAKAKAEAAQAKPREERPEVSTRRKRLEAAVTPRGTGGHASGGSSDIDEMEAGYNG